MNSPEPSKFINSDHSFLWALLHPPHPDNAVLPCDRSITLWPYDTKGLNRGAKFWFWLFTFDQTKWMFMSILSATTATSIIQGCKLAYSLKRKRIMESSNIFSELRSSIKTLVWHTDHSSGCSSDGCGFTEHLASIKIMINKSWA